MTANLKSEPDFARNFSLSVPDPYPDPLVRLRGEIADFEEIFGRNRLPNPVNCSPPCRPRRRRKPVKQVSFQAISWYFLGDHGIEQPFGIRFQKAGIGPVVT
jgi:hypothetical protein